MSFRLSRRECLATMAAPLRAGAQNRAVEPAASGGDLKIYFGDLHNHSDVGYGQGSLRRAYEIARNHLDFFAFTPHAHWHDIQHFAGNIEDKWINGFHITRARWPEVLAMAREFDAPGKFTTIAGYEWHSTSLGDYHVLFPDLDAELYTPDDLKDLQRFAARRGCIMVPHHPSLRQGHRGANFEHRDPRVSPLLEIYSEWGNSESDRGPFPFIRHTESGRWTRNTLQYALAHGHRFGVIASTDDHLGYPGGWGEGLAAVLAPELSRPAILEALFDRRTYAVTGDRIALRFSLNGNIMGRELPYSRERRIAVSVTGWDQLDRVEVLKNNRVIHRDFPWTARPRREVGRNRFWPGSSTAGGLGPLSASPGPAIGTSPSASGTASSKRSNPASWRDRSRRNAAMRSWSEPKRASASARSPRSASKSRTGRKRPSS